MQRDVFDNPVRNQTMRNRRRPRKSFSFFRLSFYLCLWMGLCIALFVSYLYLRLPDINELRFVKYQQPLRILTEEGALISQIGEIKRTPIEYEEIPQDLRNALLSAEDARFFNHIGLDFRGLARAVLQMVTNSPTQTGGSTITMQVARNYYLTRERTIMRKLNEILLAVKMERFISKEEILSLYINTIFLGFKSYGFAAAAETYYNTDLSELSLAQYAMLAALPKAPSALNPVRNPTRAKERRDWILGRMALLGYISQSRYSAAINEELSGRPYDQTTEVEGLFLSESVRLEILSDPESYNLFLENPDEIYTAGYRIYTSIDRDMQLYANRAVRNGLLAYDLRHGWRGPEKNFATLSDPLLFVDDNPDYTASLSELEQISSYDNSLEPVIVRQVEEQSIEVVDSTGEIINIGWEGLVWAAPYIDDETIGDVPEEAGQIVQVGDLVRISPFENGLRLSQIPRAEAAFLAMDPHNGMIKAMVGGYHFQLTKYNRAIQARRQIGSAIKPFLYTAALDRGFNGGDLLNDAPFVSRSTANFVWRPSNAGDTFLGYIPLREGLYRSRNLVSVRLMQSLGVSSTRSFMQGFDFPEDSLPNDLSLALGSAGLSLPEITKAYAVFANGGYLVEPQMIVRIEDATGELIYANDISDVPAPEYISDGCALCVKRDALPLSFLDGLQEDFDLPEELAGLSDEFCTCLKASPSDLDFAQINSESDIEDLTSQADYETGYERIISPEVHYQINSILRDVMSRGTGIRSAVLGRSDLGGKTGTTQDFVDAWFVGYNPDLVATSWVGFDDPSSLGPVEYGGVAALPIWIEFMGQALAGVPEKYFAVPDKLTKLDISIASEGNVRDFTEYVHLEKIEDYLARISENSVYVDYDYVWREPEVVRDIGIEPEAPSLFESERDQSEQLKDLF